MGDLPIVFIPKSSIHGLPEMRSEFSDDEIVRPEEGNGTTEMRPSRYSLRLATGFLRRVWVPFLMRDAVSEVSSNHRVPFLPK